MNICTFFDLTYRFSWCQSFCFWIGEYWEETQKKLKLFYFSGRTTGGGVKPPEPLIEEEKIKKKSYDTKQKNLLVMFSAAQFAQYRSTEK